MNKLNELIKSLCPNGLEYKTLIDVCCTLKKGTLKTTELIKNGNYPVINSGKDFYGSYNKYNNKANAFTFAARGEYAGFINYTDKDFWAGGLCYPYRSNNESIIKTKFIYYYLKSQEKNIMETLVSRGSIPAINKSKIDKIMLPVPPLEVQSKIIHILDNFTKCTSELTSELTSEFKARQKQYEYYRDELLKFKNKNYVQKTLGEIAIDMYRGVGIKRTEITKTGTPCVRYGEIYTSYNNTFDKCISHTNGNNIQSKKYFAYGDVLFAITGESIEEIGKSIVYLGKDKCLAGGDMVIMKHNQNPKYMAYVLSTTMAQKQKSKGKVKNKVVHTSVPALKEISIPIPPMEVQEKVANILEKLFKICNNILEDLPAEIEARQKQYEYYRDKLLTFKE